jgi:hypothetical protein
MLDVLRKRLEGGLLEEFSYSALAIPIGGEVFFVVFTQVFDLRGGVLMIDLPVFVAARPSRPGFFGLSLGWLLDRDSRIAGLTFVAKENWVVPGTWESYSRSLEC